MPWSKAVLDAVQALPDVIVNASLVSRLITLIDYTRLQDSDDEKAVRVFLERARHLPFGKPAAACLYPQFVPLAVSMLTNTSIKVATVVNFPSGNLALSAVLAAIRQALDEGAQEIDCVFPYTHFLAGDSAYAEEVVAACQSAVGEKDKLKVIVESGAFSDEERLSEACRMIAAAGADFIKTSTGKIQQGASLEAVATLLLTMKTLGLPSAKPFGLKVSGGVKTWQQAAQYLALTEQLMGKDWVSADTFRIGASQLVESGFS